MLQSRTLRLCSMLQCSKHWCGQALIHTLKSVHPGYWLNMMATNFGQYKIPPVTPVPCLSKLLSHNTARRMHVSKNTWVSSDHLHWNPPSFLGCQCSSMLLLLLCVVKWLLITCSVSSKIIQTGLCTLMSLNIHPYSLHLDVQYGQTWHLSTQLRSGERTGRRLLWSTTLL